jgi:chemotaxis protein methyltransferase CheR
MIKDSQLRAYSNLVFKKTGISISDSKKEMFHMKIQKLMRNNQIANYDEYFDIISNDNNKEKIQEFINTVTTNTTEFFREKAHFDYIKNNIDKILVNIPRIKRNREIRMWCAASSSGQEPATMAMVLRECLGEDIKIKLLATDISSKVLKKAMKGRYTFAECDGMPKYFLTKYFHRMSDGYQLKDSILGSISYRYFNLMNEFNFKNRFDIVFLRNVMIYFDNKVQETLINKIYANLVNKGMLFIGHSESLVNKKHSYKFVGPSIYMKNEDSK